MGSNMKKKKWLLVSLLVFLLLPLNSWSQSSTEKTLKTITIQVVSVKNVEKADQELARLRSHGLDPFMRYEEVRDKGMWYRIFVGQFENRDKANAYAQQIKEKGIISGFWVKRIEMPVESIKSAPTVIPKEKPEINIAAGGEEPATAPNETEAPGTAISPETTPSNTIPPIEKSETIIPEKAQDPIPTPSKMPKDISQAKDSKKKETASPVQGIAVQGSDKWTDSSRFSLGVKSSYFHATDTEDFKIEESGGGDRHIWSLENPKIYNSLFANYRFNSKTSIEAGIERAFFTKLDVWHLNMGPKFEFRKIGKLTPYAKGSLIIGHLEWDDIPGDFDTAWGWEGGLGVFLTRTNIQFGLETSYRSIQYDYNRPSGNDVTATDNQLDFSGFALSGILNYRF